MIPARLIATVGIFGAVACLFATQCLPLPLGEGRGDGRTFAAESATQKSTDAARPFGIEKRTPWTTSNFRGRPEPPLPYRAERVFPKIHFKNPTVLTSAPGTDRMFVAEQLGKIFSIPND